MASRKLEDRIHELKQFRGTSPGDGIDPIIRKALADRSNLIVAEAAKLAAMQQRTLMIPELLAALERMLKDPVKADPKCWGKTAVIKALTDLDYSESAAFLRALFHIQMEPVYGGQEDSAVHLRANAVLALVQCTDLARSEILRHLVDALNDPADPVRIEAVRALEQMNGEESVLLLRLKAQTGDSRPPVLGQVFDSLLQMERERGIPFVGRFLESESADEAALALGTSRLPDAVKVLIDKYRATATEFKLVLLRAISSSRDESALEFLLSLVKEGSTREAASALEALELYKDSPDIQARIAEAKQH